jgi:hypothetical protein
VAKAPTFIIDLNQRRQGKNRKLAVHNSLRRLCLVNLLFPIPLLERSHEHSHPTLGCAGKAVQMRASPVLEELKQYTTDSCWVTMIQQLAHPGGRKDK